jgi:VWFA-related protein
MGVAMKTHLFIAAVVSLFSIAGHAQAPTFRTETTVVQLPVRVVDAKGAFVRDLNASEIEVLEDGVPQTISQFTLVDHSTAQAPSPLTVPSSGVLTPADLEKVPGRLYVFLLDDVHLGVASSARARALVKDFIRDRVTPVDAAAVVIASGAARQDFTRDKTALLRAVDRFTGTLESGEPARVQEVRARAVVKLVTDLAVALGNIRGRHKSIVYIGSHVGCRVAMETSTDFAPRLKGEQSNSPVSTDANLSSAGAAASADSDEQILCNEQLWDGVRAAVQANVSLYAIDPRGMLNRGFISPSVDGRGGPDMARRRMAQAEAGKPSVLDGFYVLSDHTGGFAVTDTNNYRDALDRIVRESSTYYLLAYASSNNKIDGKYRRTQINVKRPGVQAFYRAGYMARRF